MWEYAVFRLQEFTGGGEAVYDRRDPGSGDPMNDAARAAGLLKARGAEGWELVPVMP